jgi:hypothetical protein
MGGCDRLLALPACLTSDKIVAAHDLSIIVRRIGTYMKPLSLIRRLKFIENHSIVRYSGFNA